MYNNIFTQCFKLYSEIGDLESLQINVLLLSECNGSYKRKQKMILFHVINST